MLMRNNANSGFQGFADENEGEFAVVAHEYHLNRNHNHSNNNASSLDSFASSMQHRSSNSNSEYNLGDDGSPPGASANRKPKRKMKIKAKPQPLTFKTSKKASTHTNNDNNDQNHYTSLMDDDNGNDNGNRNNSNTNPSNSKSKANSTMVTNAVSMTGKPIRALRVSNDPFQELVENEKQQILNRPKILVAPTASAPAIAKPAAHIKKQQQLARNETIVMQQLMSTTEQEIVAKQKLNLHKRNIIKNSLKERSEQLMADSIRLKYLQQKFHSMEKELAKDVERLRAMIEVINRDITYYEKDFNYKKQQYLESKKFMFDLHERRNQLTKHLNTIIVSNEQRKSEKMNTMMKQLSEMEHREHQNGKEQEH